MERSPEQRRRSNRQGDGPVSTWRTALIGPNGLALLLVVAGSLLHAQTTTHAVQGMPEAFGPPWQNLTGGSTTEHELVLGTDGRHIVLLTTPDGAEGRPNWAKGVTRIAELQAGPESSGVPEMWGRVPARDAAWSDVGDILHVDIDPASGMAVISALDRNHHSIWLSARQPDGLWTPPWPVPLLEFWEGDAAFAMFDVQSGREGDLLVALRPNEAGSGHPTFEGSWTGGFDVVRIPRRGNYARAHILTALNSPGDEWALAPHPVAGGWLATDGRAGEGGVDPWWIRSLPGACGEDTTAGMPITLDGHALTVRCEGQPIAGVRWSLEDAGTSMPVRELISDAEGRVALDGLPIDRGTRWTAERPAGLSCATAMAEWTDGTGQVIQRFSLMGDVWRLNLLAAMAIGDWEVNAIDRSSLPALSPVVAGDRPADWVVFHAVGSPSVSKQGTLDLKAWALECRKAEDVHVLVMGHASPDGLALDNVRLAKERARQVAAHLEFAGVPPQRIRVEGHGSDRPMVRCPEGVNCPESLAERSRRTELYLISVQRP